MNKINIPFITEVDALVTILELNGNDPKAVELARLSFIAGASCLSILINNGGYTQSEFTREMKSLAHEDLQKRKS